jgi:hypothetical protein
MAAPLGVTVRNRFPASSIAPSTAPRVGRSALRKGEGSTARLTSTLTAAAGTRLTPPQRAHFPRLPASFSGARNERPHVSQVKRIILIAILTL